MATACTSSSGRTAANGGGSSTGSTARKSRCRSAPIPKYRWRWHVPAGQRLGCWWRPAPTPAPCASKPSRRGNAPRQVRSRRSRAPGWRAALPRGRQARSRPSSRHLENHVFPSLGARPIAEIPARDIRVVVQAIDDQGAGETAGRVFQRLRSIYRYALSEDLVEIDPTYALKPSEIFRPRSVSHRLALSAADMPAFFRKLDVLRRRSFHEGGTRVADPHRCPTGRTSRSSMG